MHTPYCVPLSAMLPTIILPHPSDIITVASGTSVVSGITPGVGGSIIVNSPRADVIMEVSVRGFPSYVFTVSRGFNRVMFPPRIQIYQVMGTSSDIWYTWNEALYEAVAQ